jgi:hypothetical protein
LKAWNGFIPPQAAKINIELVDWPTLKAGLKNLIQDYGPNTNWPSRYLAAAVAMQDKQAAREALALINGNYSPEIITAPDKASLLINAMIDLCSAFFQNRVERISRNRSKYLTVNHCVD